MKKPRRIVQICISLIYTMFRAMIHMLASNMLLKLDIFEYKRILLPICNEIAHYIML